VEEEIMKKVFLAISLIIGIALFSACIVDGSWLKLVGRWQDSQTHTYVFEVYKNGEFIEYYNGNKMQWGEFVANGKQLTLNYQSPCGQQGVPCRVILTFSLSADKNKVIFKDAGGQIEYERIQ
jgi:hypothetical protein